MANIKYPKINPEKWKNAKLTIKQREEINYMVNVAKISLKQLAKQYGVSPATIKYWSDPIYRKLDIERANKRMEEKMMNDEYRKAMYQRRQETVHKRIENEPMMKAWIKTRYKKQNYTPEQRKRALRQMHEYYINNKEYSKERTRRSWRKKDYNGFRAFQKGINKMYGIMF